jgi:hypothetical protein
MSSIVFSKDMRSYSDRRTGVDRRHFSYSYYIPERRNTDDMKSGKDRRMGIDRRLYSKPFEQDNRPLEN